MERANVSKIDKRGRAERGGRRVSDSGIRQLGRSYCALALPKSLQHCRSVCDHLQTVKLCVLCRRMWILFVDLTDRRTSSWSLLCVTDILRLNFAMALV